MTLELITVNEMEVGSAPHRVLGQPAEHRGQTETSFLREIK
jgi:hypothetical protein